MRTIAIRRSDRLDEGQWLLLRAGLPGCSTSAITAATKLGASTKPSLPLHGTNALRRIFSVWAQLGGSSSGVSWLKPVYCLEHGFTSPATQYGMGDEIGGLGRSRRADLVLLNDALEVQEHLVWRPARGGK